MNDFQIDKAAVLQYVSQNSSSPVVYSQTSSAFRQLTDYLSCNQLAYTPENSMHWLQTARGCRGTLNNYSRALRQLQDMFEYGEISLKNMFRCKLPEQFESLIKSYTNDVSADYTQSHLKNIDTRCRFFLRHLFLKSGLQKIEDLSYQDVLDFYDTTLQDLNKPDICMYKATIMKFLAWLSDHQGCTIGFSLLFHFEYRNKVLDMDRFLADGNNIDTIPFKDDSDHCSPERFYASALAFITLLQNKRYAETAMNSSKATLNLLFLFLDINGFEYSREISLKWFGCTKDVFGTNAVMSRRIIFLFNDYYQKGILDPKVIYSYQQSRLSQFPDWCRVPMTSFLDLKKREGKADSSVDMYRASIMRFCHFLCSLGIEDFRQMNAGHLKKFNLTDDHKTADGKNAYNVRIRKFLLFLADHRYIDNPAIANALSSVSAPRVRNVTILSEDEKNQLISYTCENDRGLQLRNQAIIQLGLQMGLRSSDIVALQLHQIDWKKQSIHFIQEKTDVEIHLPMPVSVGNAIYLYLMQGRPSSSSPYIFILHKAPYDRISRSVCHDIITKAFPDRLSRPGGFHITRRTYATSLFRNGNGFNRVAELLGHTSNDSVLKYISLDEERIRLCPISLNAAGIPFKGGFSNE